MDKLTRLLSRCHLSWRLFLIGTATLLIGCGYPMAGSISPASVASLAPMAVSEGSELIEDTRSVGKALAPAESEPAAAVSTTQGSSPGTQPQDNCTARPAPGGFRDPLPAAQVWNPAGPKRVGIQAGHWLTEQAPPELSRLQHGTSGGGKQEWEVNLDLAQRAARFLEAAGVQVDILPSTVPPRYRAHAFISIHANGDTAGQLRGFKIARPAISSIPTTDDRLIKALNSAYGTATMLPRDDDHISVRMLHYYAFNSRRFCHAVAPGVPQAIVETGFLTNATDRQILLGNPDLAAKGIADGILAFLNETSKS